MRITPQATHHGCPPRESRTNLEALTAARMDAPRDFLIHHVFIASSPGGPEVDPLIEAGFSEGASNVHPGQGTACRRFFFDDTYLEFIWLEGPSETTSPGLARTGLGGRLGAEGDVSRVGICVLVPEGRSPPVETWEYRPPYLPADSAILMAAGSSRISEPLLFFLPESLARPLTSDLHENGTRRISEITLRLREHGPSSAELDWVVRAGLISLERRESESVHIELDGRSRGMRLTLDTPSPVTLSW